jgi:hypothetical protein
VTGTMTAEAMLVALKARGVEPFNLRDGVHEAAHALDWGLSGKWTRDRIAKAAPKGAGRKLMAEVLARAVERRVVERLGETYDPEHWLLISCMEAIKVDGYSATWEQWSAALKAAEKDPRADHLAAALIALAGAL